MLDRIKEVSGLYTQPSDNAGQPPTHKYTLRGFTTNPHTVYVLEKDELEDEDDMLSSGAQDYQWWKLDYITSSATPVQTKQVTEAEALSAASSDSRKALLIYASDRAMSHQAEPLPTQLHNFVRADNLTFQAELNAFNAQIISNDFDPTSSPHKRKASNDSDLEVEFDHSPRTGAAHDKPLNSNESSPLDPNPIDDDDVYDEDEVELLTGTHKLPPPAAMRPLAPKLPAGVVAPSNEPLHREADLQQGRGQEMQESGASSASRSLLAAGMRGKYELGSYVPEIKIEDDEGYFEGEEEEGRGAGRLKDQTR